MRITTSIALRKKGNLPDPTGEKIKTETTRELVEAGWLNADHADPDELSLEGAGVSVTFRAQPRRLVCEIGIARPLTKADEVAAMNSFRTALTILSREFKGVRFLRDSLAMTT